MFEGLFDLDSFAACRESKHILSLKGKFQIVQNYHINKESQNLEGQGHKFSTCPRLSNKQFKFESKISMPINS